MCSKDTYLLSSQTKLILFFPFLFQKNNNYDTILKNKSDNTMKLILIFCIFFLTLGCQLDPKPKKEPPQPKKEIKVVKKKVVSHMIRGTIKTQFFEKNTNLWRYKIDVIDVASDALKTFSFTYPKRLYDIGDLIYVILDQDDKKNIKDLYLIKKNYIKKEEPPKENQVKEKRTKSRKTPWIEAPKGETIKLD